MKIQIRTKDDLLKILTDEISYAWRINDVRLKSLTHVEIFNFSGTLKLSGAYDPVRTIKLPNGRYAVAFTEGKIQKMHFKWVGQNPIRYLANNQELPLSEDELDSLETGVKGDFGIYAAREIDHGHYVECLRAGDKPDFILLGTIDGDGLFMGRVITNWCDKYPSDSLIYKGRATWDQGGIAETENGEDLWEEVNQKHPMLSEEIQRAYDFFEIDGDDEHYNLAVDLPDESRLSTIFKGISIDLSYVRKGDGTSLGALLNI